ncbi:ankyrin repeat-containing domain protein [Aspergillus avenaceus]|uniref:Ankyrin repeat-containing domain protein n=1 Tax=Aspergillus avenaceus TaxID=36643 RepID=A0A5N6TM03_ASPAV|nr:ankyrin repeat-containing domain protein [Aspergillus avenaceus]
MSRLHAQSRIGNLKHSDLKRYLETIDIDSTDENGYTPLSLAVKNGHPSAVKILLQQGADPNKCTRDGRSPLYLAASGKQNRARIVELLLENKASVDEPRPEYDNDTPLMMAITKGRDPDVIRQLVDAGASLAKSNDRGDTARSLADQMADPAIRNALLPKEQQGRGRAELIQLLISAALLALACIGNWKGWKGIVSDAIRTIYTFTSQKLNGSNPPPGTDFEDPETSEQFKHNINNIVQKCGLEDFYPPGDSYVDQVASKAAKLKKDPNATLNSSDDICNLARVALYQPILYCDDSGSMNQDGRAEGQRALVKRITNVATRLVPQNNGVHLRFINRDDTTANNLRQSDIEQRMQFTPTGSSEIGTNLRTKILQPFVYDVLSSGVLERPILVMTITDGCPEGEDTLEFRNAVVKCTEWLSMGSYEEDAVMFCLSQIGNDPEAVRFLETFDDDSDIEEVVFRTAEHLDDRFRELRDNERELDRWILQMLNEPFAYRN